MSPSKDFHSFKILGKTTITSVEDRRRPFSALNRGNAESSGFVAWCFNPRHGMRASDHGRTADLVICFECLQVVAYLNDKRAGHFITSEPPQPLFDELLRKSGVQRAKKPREG